MPGPDPPRQRLARVKGYDFFTHYVSLFLTPTTFLSGVFFPPDPLPGVMRVISDGLLLTAAVKLIRPLFLGQWPAQALHPLAVLTVQAMTAWRVALALTCKRFFNQTRHLRTTDGRKQLFI